MMRLNSSAGLGLQASDLGRLQNLCNDTFLSVSRKESNKPFTVTAPTALNPKSHTL